MAYSRRTTVTATVLNEYRDMIKNTTSDLEDHLQDVENKLDSFIPKGTKMEHEDSMQWSRIQEERNSTQQCLRICADALEHKHAERLKARLEAMSQAAKMEETAEWEQFQEERNSLRQCLAICAEASEQTKQVRFNEFEDVLSADDAHQVIVSTLGELISAKRITTGSRSAQWLGQMSDETLQQLSRDRSRVSEGPVRAEMGPDNKFDQYGRGHQLQGKHSTVRSDSPTQPL
ncbi:predicted protein [Histoplasma mississippiense (nom. inval.)]|uniref:predicted protein n=1 Tax=Ajellomyces capsulatus (strain NAm1 / WU24) TaxID=2059318 RepID=UPI000157D2C9|nr:predicted protein [Histoplasma mississippiense (nom. inval.)]EDN04893.1 predicted protein [Histoplasma mississippiense (nom. inval.)]